MTGATTIIQGDVREVLRTLPSAYFDCVVTSPPYWGLRDYGVDGQIGLERTLGEHLDVLVGIFREVRRVLKAHGTVWLNYGDCYAAAPNGKSAAAYKADGSTVGPIYQIDDSKRQQSRRGRSGNLGNGGINGVGIPNGRIVSGGTLKPKDLCMISNRLAIALQDDGWWVRSEIIWHKPNPMPESTYDRPTTAHEKVWLLTKSEDYFYNHAAIRETCGANTHARKAGPNSRQNVDRVPRSRKIGIGPRSAEESDAFRKAKESFHAGTLELAETRNARNVWTIAPRAYREAHFATFPPALAERCMKAGVPALACSFCGHALPQPTCHGACQITAAVPGRVLDPFGGAGTVGLVAKQLGVEATLIELNSEYVALTKKRLGMIDAPLQAAE